MDCAEDRCPEQCESAFALIRVSHLILGGTRVWWELQDGFTDPGPYVFQLEVGRTGNPQADDWEEVGMPVTDTYWAIDDEQRVWGSVNWTHYRVRLETANGTYYSQPEAGMGVYSRAEWRLARELMRKEKLRMKRAHCPDGYLLKRKVAGQPCSCLDLLTRECRIPNHADCYGTGWIDGYFPPMPCIYADFGLKAIDYDFGEGTGKTAVLVIPTRMLAVPDLHRLDVWVNRKTDERWVVHRIESKADVRAIPVILSVELRLLPFSDPVYTLEIEGQAE